MKMSMMGVPGNWASPTSWACCPGMTGFATKLMKKKMTEVGAPPVREYLEMMQDGGAKLYRLQDDRAT